MERLGFGAVVATFSSGMVSFNRSEAAEKLFSGENSPQQLKPVKKQSTYRSA